MKRSLLRLYSLLFLFLFLFIQLMAQNRTLTGRVTDASGIPIPGVSVTIKGTSAGSTTNDDGRFSVSAPANARVIQFTAVGMATQDFNIENNTVINPVMRRATGNLEEVQVVALGRSQSKRSLGYSTQTIKNEEIAEKGEVNIVNALQGKVAGVDITGASGAAGSSANINIRGITSFTGSNQPLFVIDGIPMSNDLDRSGNSLFDQQPPNRAMDLDINDIESVNVLKGPAAGAIYGSRASAGVIVITTKKGNADNFN